MDNVAKIRAIQGILGVDQDGNWGPVTQAALDALRPHVPLHGTVHTFASSFADPEDLRRFHACKAKCRDAGMSEHDSDLECFKVGDNGIGCWGDDVTTDEPACALPPEDMFERWGSMDAAKHKVVLVSNGTHEIRCILKDRMRHRAQIPVGGAFIDLAPAACKLLGFQPPVMAPVTWRWED